MSERRKLVFWPRVEGSTFQNPSEAKFCEDLDFDDKNNTPEELSETESDAYYSPSPQVSEYLLHIIVYKLYLAFLCAEDHHPLNI